MPEKTIFGPKFLNRSIVYMEQGNASRLFLSDDDEGRFLRQTKVGRLSAVDAVRSILGVQTQYAQKNNLLGNQNCTFKS